MEPVRVLIVEDELDVLEAARGALQEKGYQVYAASSGEEGFRYFKAVNPQLLLIDHKLSGISGMDFLRAAKADNPKVRAIFMTGLIDEADTLEAQSKQLGADAFLFKPLTWPHLHLLIQKFTQEQNPPLS